MSDTVEHLDNLKSLYNPEWVEHEVYFCSICEYEGVKDAWHKTEKGVKEHIRKVHGDHKLVHCEKCGELVYGRLNYAKMRMCSNCEWKVKERAKIEKEVEARVSRKIGDNMIKAFDREWGF